MDEEISPTTSETVLEARKLEFSLFYRKNMPSLVAFLLMQRVPIHFATDLAQDVMTKAFTNWDEIYSPRAWVRKVAIRQWWRLMEARRQEIPAENLPEASGLLSGPHAEEIVNRHTFLAAVQDLSPEKQQALAWTYDGYLPNEIAELMGVPATTVRSMLRDARAVLRKRHGHMREEP
nr:sigma-70 family RNA polymerase sigma factor [uncultured Actinoplanes sp.]